MVCVVIVVVVARCGEVLVVVVAGVGLIIIVGVVGAVGGSAVSVVKGGGGAGMRFNSLPSQGVNGFHSYVCERSGVVPLLGGALNARISVSDKVGGSSVRVITVRITNISLEP